MLEWLAGSHASCASSFHFLSFPSPTHSVLEFFCCSFDFSRCSSFTSQPEGAARLPESANLFTQIPNQEAFKQLTLHDISILNHIEPLSILSNKRSLITSCWISRCKARRCCSPSSVSSCTAGAVVSVVFTFFSLASLGLSVLSVCGASMDFEAFFLVERFSLLSLFLCSNSGLLTVSVSAPWTDSWTFDFFDFSFAAASGRLDLRVSPSKCLRFMATLHGQTVRTGGHSST